MIDQLDMALLAEFHPCYIRWEQDQIFTGFGTRGLNLIAKVHKEITGSNANMSCGTCVLEAAKKVFTEYRKQTEDASKFQA